MNERTETDGATQDAKRPLHERLVICLRWSWSPGFWRAWRNEAYGATIMLWMGFVGFFGGAAQICFVVVYPVWKLVIDPTLAAVRMDNKTLENIKRIVDR